MTLPQAAFDDADGGGTPIIPRPMSPEAFASFSAADMRADLSSAATSVQQTLGNAASSVSTAAQNLWSSVTGKDASTTARTPIVALPDVKISGTSSSTSMTWLWVLVGALLLFFGYREFAGKGKRKPFSKFRASGTHVKSYGK